MKSPILLLLLVPMTWLSCTGIMPFSPYAGNYSSQMARRLTPVENPATGLYGYVNDLGLWVIQPRYQSANRFGANGLARVRLGARYGAINMAGKTVINFNFSNGYDVDAAILSMGKGRMRGIELWEEQDPRTGLYGYLDYYGTWFIKPQYYRARAFNREGYAVVEMKRGQWGAIDRNNRIVIQPNFTSSYDAENALRRLMGY